MACSGNSVDHCCIFNGIVCEYLEENSVPGRRWACGLMREMGEDWDKVITSEAYIQNIVPLYKKHIWPHYDVKHNCKTWPSDTCDCRHGDG
jgi:hypothetical protein